MTRAIAIVCAIACALSAGCAVRCLKPRDAPWPPADLAPLVDAAKAAGLDAKLVAREVVIARAGEPAGDDAYVAFVNAHGHPDLLKIDGVDSMGVGGCAEPPRACVQITIHDGTRAMSELPAALARALDGDSRAMTFAISVIPRPAARCSPSDPNCGPISYVRRCTVFRSGPRKPVARFGGSGRSKHDGECRVDGCGNDCVSVEVRPFAAICPYYPALEGAYCGCVEHRCTWFK